MITTQLQFHEVAGIFPMMDEAALQELAEDIAENGLREPICIDSENRIVDGRNRYLACKRVDAEMRFYDCPETESLVDLVLSLNLHRRHLEKGQRATAATRAMAFYASEAKERQGTRTDIVEIVPPSERGKARDKAGEKFGVSGKYVSDAIAIRDVDPELFKQIDEGEKTIPEAKRELKKREVAKIAAEARDQARDDDPGLITDLEKAGPFRTIYADPPWQYNRTVGQGVACDEYPTMSIDDLAALPVGDLAHPDGCHLWLWTTWPMIRDRAPDRLLDTWGLTWRSQLVWDKQALGLGSWLRSQIEVLILATKGKTQLLRNDERDFLSVKRSDHSAKPEEVRELIERVSSPPSIELFARKSVEGWSRWGLEA